jgi:MFS family permease
LLIPKNECIPSSAVVPTHASSAATAHDTKSGNRLFLLLATLLTLQSLVISSISVHLLDVLKMLGIATATALAIGMIIGPSQVVARLAEFSLGRNLHPTTSAKVAILLSGIGIGLLLPAIPWLAFIAMALYGAGNGILTIARGTLPLALFGQDSYGTRMGLLARPMLVAQAVGPVAASVILDKLGSTPLLVVMCTLATASLIASFGLSSK